MSIFKYKKPNGSIAEMPIISNTFTEYVVQNTTGTRTITLTPTHIQESTGAGSFENVMASVKLLSSNPTYTPQATAQTYTFSSLYGSNGFPSAVTVEAIPSNWLNKTTDASTPPSTTTISNKNDNVVIPAGYYENDITVELSNTAKNQLISNNFLYNTTVLGITGQNTNNRNTALTIVAEPTSSNKSGAAAGQILKNYRAWVNGSLIEGSIEKRGNINNQTQIKPSNYTSAYYETGYYDGGSTNGKINIATGTVTFTANKDSYTSADWGDYFPTSIKVEVPASGINTNNGTAYSTLFANADRIPSGYKVYGSGSSNYVLGTMNSYLKDNSIVTPLESQGATRLIEKGYHDGKETIQVSLPVASPPEDIQITTPGEQITIAAGYYADSFIVTSNLPNRGSSDVTFTDINYNAVSRSEGYYSAGTITIDSNNLKKEYIKKDISILGVTGTYEATIPSNYQDTSDATENPNNIYILEDYKLYKKSGSITGTMKNRGTMTATFTDSNYSQINREAGYYSAGNISINSTNLKAENIKKDVTILGVTGTLISYDSTNQLIGLIDKSITQIDIPFGITKVGNYVFYNCTSLTHVTIPDTANSIDSLAFQGCTALEEVIFHGTPNSIASSAFSGDTSITDIYVPWTSGDVANAPWGATNATIHYNALEICYGQRIGESNAYWYISDNNILYITGTGAIPSSAGGSSSPWYSYKNSINKIIIGNKITSTPSHLFQNYTATEIIIGAAVTALNAYPFYNTNITTLNIPASVTSMNGPPALKSLLLTSYTVDSGNQYFSASSGILYDKNLTTLIACPSNKSIYGYTITPTVTQVGIYAFYKNSHLTTLHFNNVTKFGQYVCADCPQLTKVYFKVRPTSISNLTLSGCTELTDIYVPWASGEIGGAPWGATNATIHYDSTVY